MIECSIESLRFHLCSCDIAFVEQPTWTLNRQFGKIIYINEDQPEGIRIHTEGWGRKRSCNTMANMLREPQQPFLTASLMKRLVYNTFLNKKGKCVLDNLFSSR